MEWLAAPQWLAFLGAALLVTISPGPDNLMILSLGMSRGRRLGMAFGLGCALGCLSHTVLAAVGVSALIAASPTAFLALKVLGGLYLVRLGWMALRSSGAVQIGGPGARTETAWQLFWRGVVANAINPKVVLFFLAFLPQFVDSARGDTPWQIVQLGLTFTAQAAVLFVAFGYFAGGIGDWLQRHARAGVWLDRVAGTLFIGLGLRLILAS